MGHGLRITNYKFYFPKPQKNPYYKQKMDFLSPLSTVYPHITNFLAILSHFLF